MKRRQFISLLGSAAAWPFAPAAQTQGERVVRLGLLRATTSQQRDFEAFMEGLRGLGYLPGKHINIEPRHADGVLSRLPELASELVRWGPDIVVVDGNPSAAAMRAATSGNPLPIVFVVVADPVRLGFAASLSRPGGMMTGLSNLAIDLGTKRVELLRAAVPNLSRLGVLVHPGNYWVEHREQVHQAARALGLALDEHAADKPIEIAPALKSLARSGAQAVLTINSPLFYSERERIVSALNAARMPGMHPEREFVEVGGLMSYGIDFPAQWRRAAAYVDKIIRGVVPADLPVEQPARFELILNLRTARVLNIAIPPTLLARADEVIE